MKGLDSTKFLEILHSNKTSNKFSNHQLKIAFKHPNFVREPFQICLKIRIPLDSKHLNFKIFLLFYITSTQTIYVNQKLHTLSRFATLRAISNLFRFFFYTPCILKTIYSISILMFNYECDMYFFTYQVAVRRS